MSMNLQELLAEIIGNESRKNVAKRVEKTPGYITQIMNGDTIPSDEMAAELADKYAPARLGELLFSVARARVQKAGFKNSDLEKRVLAEFSKSSKPSRPALVKRDAGRTFNDFPHSFYPLAIVTGDKREDGNNWISPADFGAKTATPADTRWLLNLGLAANVVKHIDKNFLLLPEEQLIQRFAETNLLVIGSPAANHLARRLNPFAIFRFNYGIAKGQLIEKLIEEAKGMPKKDLPELLTQRRIAQERLIRSLFAGGILDPTNPDEYTHATYWQVAQNTQRDWGLLSFAPNPFYARKCELENRPNDQRYVSILAAGIHHPGTAHAVRQLATDRREAGAFRLHPYGGVIRVEMNPQLAFAERVEAAECVWEDEVGNTSIEKEQQRTMISRGLSRIAEALDKQELAHLELTSSQARACIDFFKQL